MKILCYGTYVVGFETMVIMDLCGMTFHAVVVIALFLSRVDLAFIFMFNNIYTK